MRIMLSALCVTLLAVGLAAPAAAQNPAAAPAGVDDLDARWLPWMGCWRLAEERIGTADEGTESPEPMEVCITPAEEGRGAALTAHGDGEALLQRALVADGARRDVTEGDCAGWERREWSADGHRLFTRAEIRCGTEPPRRMSGISLLVNRSTWVDVQGVAIDDRRHVEIRRYRPAPADDALEARLPAAPRELREARQAAAGPLTLAGVREATARADSHVVEALLTESEPKLPLDARTLIELDDAGVDGGVIDLLVALAYPEQFVVERRAGGSGGGGGGWGTGWGGYGGAYAPIYYSGAMYGMYAPWGYGGYWYSPYWNGYGYRPGVGGPGVGVRSDGSVRSDGPTRVIDGRGFTRVQPRTAVARRNPDGGGGAGGGSGGARPRSGGSSAPSSGGWSGGGRSGGGATRATPGGFTRSGGGGGSSSSGASSSSGGSSSGGGGRAVPRQP